MPPATAKTKKRAAAGATPKTVTLRASVEEHQKFYDICSEMQRGNPSKVTLNSVMHRLIDGFELGTKKTHIQQQESDAPQKSVSLALNAEDKLKVWTIALEMSSTFGKRFSVNAAMCQLIRDYPLQSNRSRAKRTA